MDSEEREMSEQGGSLGPDRLPLRHVVSQDDPVAALCPPSLLKTTLSVLRERFGVELVRDLLRLNPEEVIGIRGVGETKIRALEELQALAAAALPEATATDAEDELAEPRSASLLAKMLVAARVVFGAETLGDVGRLDWTQLLTLAAPDGSARDSDLRDLAPSAFAFFDVGRVVSIGISRVDEQGRYLLERTLFAQPGESVTLAVLGTQLSVTRERVRQMRESAAATFDEVAAPLLRTVAPWARHLAGGAVRVSSLDARWSPLLGTTTGDLRRLSTQALLRESGYRVHTNGWAETPHARDQRVAARERFQASGRSTGIVSDAVIAEALHGCRVLDDERDVYLEEVAGLTRFHDAWIPRDSVRARVLAALSLAGAPATKDELARVAGTTPGRVSSYLSGIEGVCRADKDRWAFDEWVDDPYDGIVGEILQRVDEDGGQTTVERLVQELPRQFGVSESSVRSYIKTPMFVVKDGMVRRATDDEVATTYYGNVRDTPTAVRLADGTWAARVSVTDALFSGYSATIPASIAQAGGVRPGDSLLVPVDGTPLTVSVIWRVHNLNRTVDLGRLAPVLEHLGLSVGNELLVAPGRDWVRVLASSDATIAPTHVEDVESPESIDAALDELFRR